MPISTIMSPLAFARVMSTDDDSSGGATTMEVDLDGGVKATMPIEQAKRYIAARDANKGKLREQETRLGALQATADEATAKARRAEEDRLATDHAKKGELDKVRELMTTEHRGKLDKISGTMARDRLRAALASHPKILKDTIGDAVELLRSRLRFDVDSEKFQVLNEAGQPLTDKTGAAVDVDTFVDSWLSERPHYQRDATPSGSGAERGGRPGTAEPDTITRAEYDQAAKDRMSNKRSAEIHRKVAKGLMRVIDPE